MLKIQGATNQKTPGTFKKFIPPAIDDKLHHLVFFNSLQATFITTIGSEKILINKKALSNRPGIWKGIMNKKAQLFLI